MYSRAREDGGVRIPGDYCGTAFYDGIGTEAQEVPGEQENDKTDCKTMNTRCHDTESCGARARGILDIPIFSRLGDLGLSLPSFSTEDILIIATAAFLFFSKGGDKECAIMLLLLIFIAN